MRNIFQVAPFNFVMFNLVLVNVDLMSSAIHVIGLSVVKHQEPRFLIPILPCVILMCSHKLRWI